MESVGFLMIANLDHIDGQFKSKGFGGQREGCSPLPGTGLGRDVGHSLFLAVVGLGNSRVEFVGSYGAYTLVFEIDVSRCVECFFEAQGSHQWGRTPYLVHVTNLVGNFYPGIGSVELLFAEFFGKDGVEVFGGEWFLGSRIERAHRLVWHVGDNVVPGLGNLFFRENKFLGSHRHLKLNFG